MPLRPAALFALLASILAASLAVGARPARSVPVIGLLWPFSSSEALVPGGDPFRLGPRDLVSRAPTFVWSVGRRMDTTSAFPRSRVSSSV